MISFNDIDKICFLSRLSFSKKDLKTIKDDLRLILNWINQIKRVNTNNVKPLSSVFIRKIIHDVNDIKRCGNHVDFLFKNVKKSKFNMFSIPKVLD